jgi:prepilin-type N-terminal cleavage/methylation domain-containing protein
LRTTSTNLPDRAPPGGFTLAEVLVVLGIIAVLLALLLPVIGQTRSAAMSVACLANLRQVHGGFLQYAADNDKRLPDPAASQCSWEQSLRKYLPAAQVFRCKADDELFPAVGSSYDWRDTGRPDTTLAGRLVTDANRSDAVLALEALPGWHTGGRINAVRLNGSAESMDQDACLGDLLLPIRAPADVPADAKGKAP